MLASSIEGNASSKAQTELENASDEEEKFSAVVRPNHEGRDRRDARDFRDFNNRSDRGATSGAGTGSASVNTRLLIDNHGYILKKNKIIGLLV